MTPQEAKELLPIIEAFANGETIQIQRVGRPWKDISEPNFNAPSDQYRIKPKPRRVPMTAEDLPAVFWVSQDGGQKSELVTVIHPDGRLETEHFEIKPSELRNFKWSADRKTWQDFTKEVAE